MLGVKCKIVVYHINYKRNTTTAWVCCFVVLQHATSAPLAKRDCRKGFIYRSQHIDYFVYQRLSHECSYVSEFTRSINQFSVLSEAHFTYYYTMNLLPLWPSLNDKFIVAESNIDAFNAINTWPQNIIILYGSWGKSLLVTTQLHNFQHSKPDDPISERTVWDNFPHCTNSSIAFHNFNTILRENYKLCITMRDHPGKCDILPLDLKSRMKSAYLVKIRPPSLTLRKQIVTQWFSTGGIQIDQRSLDYFLSNYDNHLDVLGRSVKLLHEYALLHQRRITIACIKTVLGEAI